MSIFDSKKTKEMKRRILLKRTLSNITQYAQKLEVQQKKYLNTARDAKKAGIDSQYQLAVSGFKTALVQHRRALEMKLNIELVSQMRDLTQMTGQFLGTMKTISKEMATLAKGFDFIDVEKAFEKSMFSVTDATEKLDVMMEGMQSSHVESASTSIISDDEIDRLVQSAVASDVNNLDKEIESKLNEISSTIKD
jgi:hypothetical protein